MSCQLLGAQSLSLVPSGQACGPQYGYMCGKQQYITGICSNVSSSFKVLNSIAPTVRGTTHTCCECTLEHSSRVNRSRSLLRRMSILGQCLGELTSPNATQNQWLIINTHIHTECCFIATTSTVRRIISFQFCIIKFKLEFSVWF